MIASQKAAHAVGVHHIRYVVVRLAAQQACDRPHTAVSRGDEHREVAAGQAAQRVPADGPELLAATGSIRPSGP
ncbi:hypothetical protein GCM10017687_87470 [Streptomyces echinatus]